MLTSHHMAFTPAWQLRQRTVSWICHDPAAAAGAREHLAMRANALTCVTGGAGRRPALPGGVIIAAVSGSSAGSGAGATTPLVPGPKPAEPCVSGGPPAMPCTIIRRPLISWRLSPGTLPCNKTAALERSVDHRVHSNCMCCMALPDRMRPPHLRSGAGKPPAHDQHTAYHHSGQPAAPHAVVQVCSCCLRSC